jgi:hypothetical protein
MKLPIRNENMATPEIRMKDPIVLSTLLLGAKSPKPIVERVVNA